MPDDRFALASLYRKAGDWIKAGELLRSLVASHGGDPRYVEYYIDGLLEHGEMNSAQILSRSSRRSRPQFVRHDQPEGRPAFRL